MKTRLLIAFFLVSLLFAPSASYAEEKSAAAGTPAEPVILKEDQDLIADFSTLLAKKEDYKNYPFILSQIPVDPDNSPIFNVGEFKLKDGTKYVFALYQDKGIEGICDTPGCPFAIFMKTAKGYHRAMYIDLKSTDQKLFRKTKDGLFVLFCEVGGMRGEARWELKGETFAIKDIKKNTETCREE